MRKRLELFKELANRYKDFAMEVNLPMTHNHLRGGHQSLPKFHKKGNFISIYLADGGRTWSVSFGDSDRAASKIEVCNYSKAFSVPYNFSAKKMKELYDDVKEYLEVELIPKIEECKISKEEEKQAKIEELEKELETLKNL